MPSSSSGSSSSSPAPTRKRRPAEVEASESSESDDDTTDAGGADEEDSNAPSQTEAIVLSHAERRRQKKKQKRDSLATASPHKKRKLGDGTAASSPSGVRVDHGATSKLEAESATTTRTTSAADDPRRQKRQNSVWVGNLAFRTTEDALREFFDGVGTITRVHLPMRRGTQMHGENMGFAYVDFETQEAKVIAITLSEGRLDGRNLLIKDGDDFNGRPGKVKTIPPEGVSEGEGEGATATRGKSLSNTAQKILRSQKQPPAPTLFLGNLGFETTEESIRELFEAHRYWGQRGRGKGEGEGEAVDVEPDSAGEGEDGVAKSNDVWIRKVRMGTFEDSGACKGFGFVDFTSIEHATEALVNPRNHRLNGRNLVVEYASPDAVRRGGGARNSKRDHDRKSNKSQLGSTSAPYTKQRPPRHSELDEDAHVAETPVTATGPPRSERPGRAGHERPHTRRAKPGAALAHAQRQSAAILPSQGQKIVF